ncbi:hypothetical protein F4821DRAFT_229122 [Hypoxylon rubiginosum]|uniref:Uncharacterized protein n=1 Tax=Hypoxylon rubiginosum TaxID=110542 RepID=A0ACC0DCR4_9PEZI|nr:hypothetical protein F4821DRAFT_229122 [Hypoxylon rubiginosum]
MLLRVFRTNRNQVFSSYRHGATWTRYSPRAPFTSAAVRGAVKFDQTKKSNDPSQEQTEAHHEQAKQAETSSDDGARGHPAKQSDPQPSPSKSTGIMSEGPGSSKAGEGADRGVHKEKGMEGGQHDNIPFPIKKKVQGPGN